MTTNDVLRLFLDIRREAFRLEQLERYAVEEDDELLAAWREGRSIRRTPADSAWLRLIADHTAAGRRVYRVHVIDWPLSEYTRFELACYPDNVAAGEEVYLVDRDAAPALAALAEDFWLFDDEAAALMPYDHDGRPLDPEPATDVAAYRARRDVALAHALPLDEWLTAHRDQLEELRKSA